MGIDRRGEFLRHGPDSHAPGGPGHLFAHNSERQFATLLDFYDIPWNYEPHSFPIAWDGEGRPSQYFTPDFYLPGENLYIEITTMSQKLVTKKNGKVKTLRRLYPDVTCKILYQRDYLHLVEKYGLETPTNLPHDPRPQRPPGPPTVVRLGGRGPQAR